MITSKLDSHPLMPTHSFQLLSHSKKKLQKLEELKKLKKLQKLEELKKLKKLEELKKLEKLEGVWEMENGGFRL